ncbi:MAG TPA: hypothetical protein PKC41_10925, partial [Chitinophagaceae bacterium]|nr:hypothetical protein [Chitinophagaceae bacterium]
AGNNKINSNNTGFNIFNLKANCGDISFNSFREEEATPKKCWLSNSTTKLPTIIDIDMMAQNITNWMAGL